MKSGGKKRARGLFIGGKLVYSYKMHPTEKNKIIIDKEIASLKAKIDSLTAHLDKVYMDKRSVILDEADFQRIYVKVKADRAALEQRLSQLERPDYSPLEQLDLAKKLVDQFLETAFTNRALLVSLIERVELTADKQIIIKFCFKRLKTE